MYTVTVGVYAYWGPKAVSSLFDTDDADFLVGAITAVSGFSGTLLGGYVLSKVFKGDGKPGMRSELKTSFSSFQPLLD